MADRSDDLVHRPQVFHHEIGGRRRAASPPGRPPFDRERPEAVHPPAGHVVLGVADHEDVLRRDRMPGQDLELPPRDGRDRSPILGVAAEAPFGEIAIQVEGVELHAGARLDVAGQKAQRDARILLQPVEETGEPRAEHGAARPGDLVQVAEVGLEQRFEARLEVRRLDAGHPGDVTDDDRVGPAVERHLFHERLGVLQGERLLEGEAERPAAGASAADQGAVDVEENEFHGWGAPRSGVNDDVPAFDPAGEQADRGRRIHRVLSGGEVERPVVPRAGDGAVCDLPFGDGTAAVGTDVFDGVEGAADVANDHRLAVDLDRPEHPGTELSRRADGPCRHQWLPGSAADSSTENDCPQPQVDAAFGFPKVKPEP